MLGGNKVKELAEFSLSALTAAGLIKAQVRETIKSRDELSFEAGRIALLRTDQNVELRLSGIRDARLVAMTLNKTGETEITEAAKRMLRTAESLPADEFLDIAEKQPPAEFNNGILAPDRDRMYSRLKEFLETVKERHPLVKLGTVSIAFNLENTRFLNSNGVDFRATAGNYEVLVVYSSQKNGKVSSLGYSYFFTKDLSLPLIGNASCSSLLGQSAKHLDAKPVKGKFKGDVILAPDCAGQFFEFVSNSVGDTGMIEGTSPYRNRRGEMIASRELTFSSSPVSDGIAATSFITSEGYPAKEVEIIKKGILKSYMLSHYGARKTGMKFSDSDGGGNRVSPGKMSYQQMIKNVRRGLLVVGFSGAKPDNKGDVSGVVKNSFYIENGRILFPVSETMISGNIPSMLLNIKNISKETVNFGNCVYPWIHIAGVDISGK